MSRWVRKWEVESESSEKIYVVAQNDMGEYGCSCPAWKFQRGENNKPCKHILRIMKQITPRSLHDVMVPLSDDEQRKVQQMFESRTKKKALPEETRTIKAAGPTPIYTDGDIRGRL
jgi:hypothetical protein